MELSRDSQSEQSPGTLTIMSYNLNFHTAYSEIEQLADSYETDVVCLQECRVDKISSQVGKLILGAVTERGNQGLVTYYNPDRLSVQAVRSLPLQRSLYEWLVPEKRERLLATTFVSYAFNSTIAVANVHATHLVASNHLRRSQVRSAIRQIKAHNADMPLVMVGDYNYPFFKNGLRREVGAHGCTLSMSDQPTYRAKIFNGHFDYAATKGVFVNKLSVLPFGRSDHAPILLRVSSLRHAS